MAMMSVQVKPMDEPNQQPEETTCGKTFTKKMFKASRLFEAIAPAFVLTTLAGISPYRLHISEGVLREKVSYIGLICCGIIISTITTCLVIMEDTNGSMTVILYGDSYIHTVGDHFQLSASSLTAYINIFLSIWKRKQLTIIIQEFMDLDASFKALGIFADYPRVQSIIAVYATVHTVAVAVAIAGFITIMVKTGAVPYFSFAVPCGLSLYNTLVLVFIFLMYIKLLTHRFNHLNKGLSTLDVADPRASARILQLRRIHFNLCKVAGLLNQYFSVQILIIIGVSFITIVFHLFYVLDGLAEASLDKKTVYFIVYCVGLCVVQLSNILIISFHCNAIMGAATCTGVIIHKLLNADDVEETVKDKLILFAMQMSQLTPKFTAFGLFPLDNTLLFTVIGALTTYLIILTQFAASSNL